MTVFFKSLLQYKSPIFIFSEGTIIVMFPKHANNKRNKRGPFPSVSSALINNLTRIGDVKPCERILATAFCHSASRHTVWQPIHNRQGKGHVKELIEKLV